MSSSTEAWRALAGDALRAAGGALEPFACEGETASLLRSVDWSGTALGAVGGWSRSLRTVLGLVLRNPAPMALWWGPRLAQLYNDAYRPILGSKHPRSLGQPASECWAEIWGVLGPMVETPFAGGPGSARGGLRLLVDRKGFLEETHLDVACGPVPDEDVANGIGGVLATVCEITRQVQGERQLRTLRELAARTADARSAGEVCEIAAATLGEDPADVPFALLYLVDPDGGRARLAASCRVDAGPARPASADLREFEERPCPGWPLARVVSDGRPAVLRDVLRRFGPLSGGAWDEPPGTALALPLAIAGDPRPQGVLVAGVSPHRELDDRYRSFLDLTAARISIALREARERQVVRRRLERLAEIDRAEAELRKVEEQRRVTEAARERLAETLRLNELFVAVLGHDLRTPLSAISLGAGILLKRSALRPDDARAVARIASSADRIARMIGQVLDLTRSRMGGGIPVCPERLDLHELARKVVDELKLAHPEATFRLQREGDAWGRWDPDRLAQVLSNLGGNAVQHGEEAPVTVTVSGAPDAVSLSVHNSGPPIPAESVDTLFDAFRGGTRTPAGSSGLGLGLYITREIVRAHGGSILVRSSETLGTTFTVVLPRAAASRDAVPAAADTQTPPPRE